MASGSESLSHSSPHNRSEGLLANVWQRIKSRYWSHSAGEHDNEESAVASSHKRMRSHSQPAVSTNNGVGADPRYEEGPTPRRRVEVETAPQQGGMGYTVARQAPAAQQQRRHQNFWYDEKNEGPKSPTPSFPLPHQQQQQQQLYDDFGPVNGTMRDGVPQRLGSKLQHFQRPGAVHRRSASTSSVGDVVRAQQQQQGRHNAWAQPMSQRLAGKAHSVVPSRPGSTVVSDPQQPLDSPTGLASSGSLLATATSSATTRQLFSAAATMGSTSAPRLAVALRGSTSMLSRPPLHSQHVSLRPSHKFSEDNVASYMEDDLLSAATLAARVREAQQVLDRRSSEASGSSSSKHILDNLSQLELEDSRLRALYNIVMLDVVEEETASIVHGLVGRANGAVDALIRSLVVPAVTSQLPIPRGALKHIRSGGTVFLPLELDAADLAEIDRICPRPPEPPSISEQLTSSSNTMLPGSSWFGSVASGAMKVVGHFVHGPQLQQHDANRGGGGGVASGDQDFVIDDEGYQVRRYQLASLRGATWVNDQVINYYFHLIQRLFPDVTSLGSHLYAKLAAGDMAGALRWVRRRDIFASRVILIAINLNNAHWTLAVVDMERKRLSYYDSLQGESYDIVLQRVGAFMDHAYAASHGGRSPDVSFTTWPRSTDPATRAKYYDNLPRQSNNNDCGVFVTQFGLCAACGIAPDFTQEDITLLRNVLILEMSQKKMLKRIHR
jgi:hypothetical protein